MAIFCGVHSETESAIKPEVLGQRPGSDKDTCSVDEVPSREKQSHPLCLQKVPESVYLGFGHAQCA